MRPNETNLSKRATQQGEGREQKREREGVELGNERKRGGCSFREGEKKREDEGSAICSLLTARRS